MKPKHLVLIVALLVVLSGLTGCMQVIEDGQAGVKATFGKISDEPLNSGWHLYVPAISWIEVWNIKTQEIKERASVPSSEGLISTLDVSILFNVPKSKAAYVRKTIGPDYGRTVLEPYIREAIRNVASGYEVKALFSEKGRFEIGAKIKQFLIEKLESRGVLIQDVLLRDVTLPEKFRESIETKLRTEQESFQKEFELTKAKKDAEIEIARASGVAKSNTIIAESLSEPFLRYQWIQSLKSSSLQVVYVPTEANIPILEARRFDTKTKSASS